VVLDPFGIDARCGITHTKRPEELKDDAVSMSSSLCKLTAGI